MRDKQGIPLLQMFAQCALHGAALEAAAKLYHMGCRHPPGQPVGGLGGVLFLSYPARPGRCHPAEYLLGLRPAGRHPAPAPTGGAAHSGAGSRAGFRTHSSAGGTRLGRRPSAMTSPCPRSRRRRYSLRNLAGKSFRRNRRKQWTHCPSRTHRRTCSPRPKPCARRP